MTLKQDEIPAEPKSTIQNTKLTIISTLLGSFIGGLFGFGGSLLIFFSSQMSLEQENRQHLDDVRRETYSEFITAASRFRDDLDTIAVQAVTAGQTVVIDDCANAKSVERNANAVRTYLISTDEVNNAAYRLGKGLDDWANTLCGRTPGLPYTQEMRISSLDQFDTALFDFRSVANTTLTR